MDSSDNLVSNPNWRPPPHLQPPRGSVPRIHSNSIPHPPTPKIRRATRDNSIYSEIKDGDYADLDFNSLKKIPPTDDAASTPSGSLGRVSRVESNLLDSTTSFGSNKHSSLPLPPQECYDVPDKLSGSRYDIPLVASRQSLNPQPPAMPHRPRTQHSFTPPQPPQPHAHSLSPPPPHFWRPKNGLADRKFASMASLGTMEETYDLAPTASMALPVLASNDQLNYDVPLGRSPMKSPLEGKVLDFWALRGIATTIS